MTRTTRASVISVRGRCNAGLQLGDLFLLEGLRIVPQNRAQTCALACASLIANAGRLELHPLGLYVSCPDPGTGQGGHVVFSLSWTEYCEHN